MKWEKPELNDMNGMDSASAGCSGGSVNSDWGGCTSGTSNATPNDDPTKPGCSSGSSNSGGMGTGAY